MSLAALALGALAVATTAAGCKREHARWQPEAEGTDRAELVPAEALDPATAWDLPLYAYKAAAKRGTNLFRVRTGRQLCLQVAGQPTPSNGHGGDQLLVWDVTTPTQQIPGRAVPWGEDMTFELPAGSGERYAVRWEARGVDRVVRLEGGGAWLEVTASYLQEARTLQAAAGDAVAELPGLRRLATPIGFEYFRLGAEAPAGAVRPSYVVRTHDEQGPLRGDLPLGDSGVVLAFEPARSTWAERRLVRVAEPARPPEARTPEELFRALLPACVTIMDGKGIGSGSWIAPDGLAVTNAHVVGVDAVRVLLHDGREVPGRVVARDPVNDLALVRAAVDAPVQPVELEPRAPAVGAQVIFIGAPAGAAWSLGSGQVAAHRREEGVELFQLQAPVNPGNSGGPVFDLTGRQVGVIVSRREHASGRAIQSMGYAIPARLVLDLVRRAGTGR